MSTTTEYMTITMQCNGVALSPLSTYNAYTNVASASGTWYYYYCPYAAPPVSSTNSENSCGISCIVTNNNATSTSITIYIVLVSNGGLGGSYGTSDGQYSNGLGGGGGGGEVMKFSFVCSGKTYYNVNAILYPIGSTEANSVTITANGATDGTTYTVNPGDNGENGEDATSSSSGAGGNGGNGGSGGTASSVYGGSGGAGGSGGETNWVQTSSNGSPGTSYNGGIAYNYSPTYGTLVTFADGQSAYIALPGAQQQSGNTSSFMIYYNTTL